MSAHTWLLDKTVDGIRELDLHNQQLRTENRRLSLELQVEKCSRKSAERMLRLEQKRPAPQLPELMQYRRNRDYSTTVRIIGQMPNSGQWLCYYTTTGKTVWRDTQFLLEFYPYVVSG